MTGTVHWGFSRHYRLAEAILVYTDGQETFATLHAAKRSPDGGPPYLDSGRPLTADFLTALSRALGARLPKEILPDNALVRTLDTMIWWVREQRRPMFFSDSSDGRQFNGRPFPHPALVFKVHGRQVSVRALRDSQRPVAATKLMVAPYWNCDGRGVVCQGTMPCPEGPAMESLPQWERAFFESEFTHAAIGTVLTSHPEGELGLWRDLARPSGPFPSEYLVESRDTLESFAREPEE
jgi:PRTRC genetic system protein B